MPYAKKKTRAEDHHDSEENLQSAILSWMEEHRPDLMCVHFPNGAIRTHKERRRMLKQGMVPGMPDLLLIDAVGNHGYMEVKTDRGSISMAQWDVREELVRRGVLWALVRSLSDVRDTLADWGWDSPAVPAPASDEPAEWPDRIEGLSRLLRKALIDLPWTEAEAVTTKYGANWVRKLAPTPVEFQELWQDHKADLKKAGITLTQVRGQGWTATWYFYAKGKTAGS